MKAKVLVLAVLAGALWVSFVPVASAKWILGDGPTDLDIAQPPNALPGQLCTTRLRGRAGLNTSGDPATTKPPKPPYSPVTVQVFTAAAGTLTGSTVVGGALLTPDNVLVPALPSSATVTPERLKTPEEYDDFGSPLWEYAAAPFQIAIPYGDITVGNDVAILLSGHSAFFVGRAIVCNQADWGGETWDINAAGDALVTRTATALSVKIGTMGVADPVATYFTDCTIAGNFDARVHIRLNTWPTASSVRAALLVNNPTYPSPAGSVTVERTSFAPSGDVGSGEGYVLNAVDPGGGFLITPTIARSGSFRVKQTGGTSGTLTAYYRDSTTGGAYTVLGTSPAYPGPVSLGLQVWGAMSWITTPVKVTFSQFALTKGICI